MSTADFDLDEFLNATNVGDGHTEGSDNSGATGSTGATAIYTRTPGEIDPRLKQLSYSTLLELHRCPRSFQLYKLSAPARAETLDETITFSFGHAVGEGIAMIFMGVPLPKIMLHMALKWESPSIYDVDPKRGKSLWHAFNAVKKFFRLRTTALADYELVYIDGIPAAELSFAINLPDGFRLRGYVDVVCRHRTTGEVCVIECKTTSFSNINPALYKNSAQALGYSVVLDNIFPDLSSYRVLYVVYSTGEETYTLLPFTKTYFQRALWIRELLLDIELIKMYEEAELYPQHGESCFSFNKECRYFQICGLSIERIAKRLVPEMLDTKEYQINISLTDLLERQLQKLEQA